MKEITIKYEESKKAELLLNFVVDHLLPHITYSNRQYGDSDTDLVSKWSTQQCLVNVERYIKRFENNSRAGQEKLDIVKSIDYLIRVFYKDDLKVTKSEEQLLLERIYEDFDGMDRPLHDDVYDDLEHYIVSKR